MKRTDRSEDGAAGFTLVETVIAFAILSLALTVAVRTVTVSVHNAQRARVEVEMRQIARAILSDKLPRRAGSDQGQWDEDHSWSISVEPLSAEPGNTLRRISLRISRDSAPKMSATYLSFDSGGGR